MSDVVTVSDADFDSVLADSPRPVLVDFWAEWCGPCKQIAPVLADIARDHGERITIAKVDIDANPGVARRFAVMSIPTLMVFANGEVSKRIVGARTKERLIDELSEYLD